MLQNCGEKANNNGSDKEEVQVGLSARHPLSISGFEVRQVSLSTVFASRYRLSNLGTGEEKVTLLFFKHRHDVHDGFLAHR